MSHQLRALHSQAPVAPMKKKIYPELKKLAEAYGDEQVANGKSIAR